MMAQFELFKKDCLKLKFLKEINNKNVDVVLFLEADGVEKKLLDIRPTGESTYRFNNFTITENETSNEIEFKPNVIGCYVYLKITCTEPVEFEVLRNGAVDVEQKFSLEEGVSKIELNPINMKEYQVRTRLMESFNNKTENAKPSLKLNESDPKALDKYNESASTLEKVNTCLDADIKSVQSKIQVLESQKTELSNRKLEYKNHLDKLQAEYDKDYSGYEEELEQLKATYSIDKELIKMYENSEPEPVENLIRNVEEALAKLEDRIKVFVEAKAKKTAAIEEELRVGKKG